jgi:uncharacterized FlaG/YvyC family protein
VVLALNPSSILVLFLTLITACFIIFVSVGRKASSQGPSILTMLGILGTFVGIGIGLLRFDPNDVQGSVPMLINGIRTAFWASALGVFFAIILKIIRSFTSGRNIVDTNPIQSMAASLEAIRFGLIGESDATIVNQIQLLRINMNDKLEKIITSQNAFMQEMAKSNSEALITALQEVMRDFNAKINEQFGDNFKQLNQAVGKLLEWQENYKKTLNDLISLQEVGAQNLLTASEKFTEVSNKAERFSDVAAKLGSVVAQIEEYGVNLNSLSSSTAESIAMLTKSVPDFKEKVLSLVRDLSKGIQDSSKTSNDALQQASEEIQSQVKALDTALEVELTKALQSMLIGLTSPEPGPAFRP